MGIFKKYVRQTEKRQIAVDRCVRQQANRHANVITIRDRQSCRQTDKQLSGKLNAYRDN